MTRKCFYDMYQCDPVKYAMKLLQKDIHSCNPVPRVANATVYEERWRLATYHATVACSCVTTKPARSQQQRNLFRKDARLWTRRLHMLDKPRSADKLFENNYG
ncbi:hypothetical protein Btru_048636 [Bulinus truncatus]|nr:hypothetical protein Btru_048636 [Bulinus truncatus]